MKTWRMLLKTVCVCMCTVVCRIMTKYTVNNITTGLNYRVHNFFREKVNLVSNFADCHMEKSEQTVSVQNKSFIAADGYL